MSAVAFFSIYAVLQLCETAADKIQQTTFMTDSKSCVTQTLLTRPIKKQNTLIFSDKLAFTTAILQEYVRVGLE